MNAMLSRCIQTRSRTISTRPVAVNHTVFLRCEAARRWSCRRSAVARAAVPGRSPGAEAAILKLTDSLRLLETERDEAVGTAESSARSAVKLEEMTRLLERLALDKVAEGDEAGARQVLQEKAAVAEVLSRTSARAQTNFALAAKLAEKIGQQQADLMALLAGNGGSAPAASSSAAPNAAAAAATPPSSPSAANTSSSYPSYRSSSTSTTYPSNSSSTSTSGSSSRRYEAPWERSLAEAQERIKQAESDAAAAGSAAARRGRESLEEARDRLRQSAWASVAQARSRIQANASESIEAARARIAAEDAAVLAQVHTLIDRYKAGQYVSEDDLDWAFRQLERRAWRS